MVDFVRSKERERGRERERERERERGREREYMEFTCIPNDNHTLVPKLPASVVRFNKLSWWRINRFSFSIQSTNTQHVSYA